MRKSEAITNLIEHALTYDRKLQQEKRLESKGGDPTKLNPYATDFGRCERAVGYSLLNVAESNPADLQSLANFLFGHAAEDAYARILGQLPEPESMVILREVRLEIDGTSGRADFLIWDPALRCIVEMKSSKGWQRKYLPSEQHVKQLRFYMHGGKLGMLRQYGIEPDDCDTAVLAYIIKDATRGKPTFLTYDVLYDERAILRDLEKNKELAAQAQAGILPARPKGMVESKFPCSYCSWKDECWR